ncbi:MAG: hypothetical protein WCL29_04160, partial [Pseudomonadota bacterium]
MDKKPSEALLKMLGRTALKQNDQAGYIDALERLVILYPSREIWADLISRTANLPTMTDRYLQDLFRLQMALGEKLTASQYMFLAQNAMQTGFPIDAKQILDNGFTVGVLGGAVEHKQLRDKSTKDADDDMKNMVRTSAEAAKGKDGPGLFNSGLNFVISGDKTRGLAMMEDGIKRAGIKRPADAKLRLGITYALSGEGVKAIEILASTSGPEGLSDVARIWSTFAKQAAHANATKDVKAIKEAAR